MEAPIFTKEEVRAKFAAGWHCAQCTLVPWAEALGYDADELLRMAAAFGGGMFRGDTCGAVGGAMLAIGARYGHFEPHDKEGDLRQQAKVKEFQDRFTERFGSTICRELLGFDFSNKEELAKAVQSGDMMKKCPGFVEGALEILEDIL